MHGRPVTNEDRRQILKLRKTGHSLPEILKITGRGNSTVFSIVRDVIVEEPYLSMLRAKQGGSKVLARKRWELAALDAVKKVGTLSERDKLLILAALYWGEGNKTELNLVNSDPALIHVFIMCLKALGVEQKDIRVSARIFSDMDRNDVLKFWSTITLVPVSEFRTIEVIHGKEKGKLKYGMCRVRVRKAQAFFKSIMSMIECVKSELNCPRSTTDSAAAS